MAKPSQSQYKVFVAVASYICLACFLGGKLYLFEVRPDRRLRTPPNGVLHRNSVSSRHSFLSQRTIYPSRDVYI